MLIVRDHGREQGEAKLALLQAVRIGVHAVLSEKSEPQGAFKKYQDELVAAANAQPKRRAWRPSKHRQSGG